MSHRKLWSIFLGKAKPTIFLLTPVEHPQDSLKEMFVLALEPFMYASLGSVLNEVLVLHFIQRLDAEPTISRLLVTLLIEHQA